MVAQTQPQAKAQWVFDPIHSSIEFAAKHMVISTARGHFAKVDVQVELDEGRPDRSKVEARIDAASLDTSDEKRDAHLRSPDFLDVEKFPWITFVSRRIEPKGGDRYAIIGELTIHGVTREVVLDTELTGRVKDPWGNERVGFSARTAINRKDFGLTWNAVLETGGLVVGENVKINIETELVKQKG